ncbi:CinA family nicotinamide mononucleotide deamidase-related protein [Photobacterium sp. GJ3]|uniref:CinA family nicotinamide mononucleotide deamidase-related protein n=1 Tax=Photobacterium sp. GJ3 TaxID=2829502 RepID=UPI001B8D383C|nr:CinA family nicotinamide mononucleotide deamidase-related protein [Photobacterium sp. GJ3]QUJ66355.1 CinA family nicotinamide mononucleotide deamidase-related protein [Photobacterium sp. GJ3]
MLQVVMISTGEEVLHGDIVDTNAAWLSRLFFQHGFALSRRTTVGDHLEILASEIEQCSLTADLVIVNGGLGPTTDDLTAQAAAVAAGVGLEQSEFWVEQMLEKYRAFGREMPQGNLKQAMLPEGAEILDNPVGTACGFQMKLNRAHLFFTPGVPSEFQVMVEQEILPRMKALHPEVSTLECHRLYCFGLSESGINDTLSTLNLPPLFQLGYRSSMPFIEVKLFTPKGDAQVPVVMNEIRKHLGENIVGVGLTMLDTIGSHFSQSPLTLTVAEQFTGGDVLNWLQDNPATQSALSQAWLLTTHVDPSISDAEPMGAALAMAAAARQQTGSDLALVCGSLHEGAISIALSTPKGDWAQHVRTKRDYGNKAHRKMVATLMLDMLRRWQSGETVVGQYESFETLSELFLPVEPM